MIKLTPFVNQNQNILPVRFSSFKHTESKWPKKGYFEIYKKKNALHQQVSYPVFICVFYGFFLLLCAFFEFQLAATNTYIAHLYGCLHGYIYMSQNLQ